MRTTDGHQIMISPLHRRDGWVMLTVLRCTLSNRKQVFLGSLMLLLTRRLRLSMTAHVFNALCLLALSAVLGHKPARADEIPTPEEYSAHVGGAPILKPGELKLDGRRQICGQRPTVIDRNLDDYGAAYPGFLILNPRLMDRVSTPVKLWIYAHECGHQFRGPDEETADCFAVQRGRRQGWLTPDGLEEICKFISPAKGSSMHLSGSHRCEYMRKCYADPTIR